MIETVRVLLVEDNVDFAASTALLLESRPEANFQVRTAGSIASAVKQIKAEKPDVIVLDLNLPNGRGLETLGQVQQAGGDVPVIVLTGLKPEEIDYEALRMGADDFITKTDLDLKGLVLKLIVSTVKADSRRKKEMVVSAVEEASESSLLKLKELSDSVDLNVNRMR